LRPEDDDDDDDDEGEESGGEEMEDDDQAAPNFPETQTTKDVSKEASSAMELDLLEWDPEFYQELEEELGGLEEEDMEAAVATLLDHTKKRNDDEDIQLQILVMKGLSRLNGRKYPSRHNRPGSARCSSQYPLRRWLEYLGLS
jgi:hypothetical protein